ncbi:MAG: tyrosine-type recombinase/integrase [Eubacteriales bacterium]|nr:tyrosine-type recombinase/integrase [Eubacteriales bacterium]
MARQTLHGKSHNDIIDKESLLVIQEMTIKETLAARYGYSFTPPSTEGGRWQTYYKDPFTGKRICIKGKTKEDVVDKLYVYIKEEKSNKKQTLTMTYEMWLEYKRSVTESSNTIKRHQQHYRKYFEGTKLFKSSIRNITKLQLDAFCNEIVKENKMSYQEWTNIKTILKGTFEYALDAGFIEANPMEKVKITVKFRQIKKKSGKTETYNTEELTTLNTWLDNRYAETQDPAVMAVRVNFFLGLRVGELVALKWSDLESIKLLHVSREEIRNQETYEREVVEHTKTRTDRFVPIVPKAYALFSRLRRDLGMDGEDGWIFVRGGERITARQVAYVLEKFAKDNGVPVKSTHKMRKTFASRAATGMDGKDGVPIDALREILGHSNLATTLNYVYDPLTERETYERLKDAL